MNIKGIGIHRATALNAREKSRMEKYKAAQRRKGKKK